MDATTPSSGTSTRRHEELVEHPGGERISAGAARERDWPPARIRDRMINENCTRLCGKTPRSSYVQRRGSRPRRPLPVSVTAPVVSGGVCEPNEFSDERGAAVGGASRTDVDTVGLTALAVVLADPVDAVWSWAARSSVVLASRQARPEGCEHGQAQSWNDSLRPRHGGGSGST